MKNWSVDEKKFKKADPEGYEIWRLEQLINFGLDGEKLNTAKVKKYWKRLSLDPSAKNYLSFLLWYGPRSANPRVKTFEAALANATLLFAQTRPRLTA